MGATTAESQFQIILNHIFAFGADFLPFIVLTALLLIFSTYFGRDRFAPLIAGLYAALALYSAFPYTLALLNGPLAKIGLYVALAVLASLAFSGLSHFISRAGGSLLSSLVLSLVVAGFLLAISMHTLPVGQVYHFTDATKALFASNQSYFLWLIAPLAGLFIFGQ